MFRHTREQPPRHLHVNMKLLIEFFIERYNSGLCNISLRILCLYENKVAAQCGNVRVTVEFLMNGSVERRQQLSAVHPHASPEINEINLA